MVLKEAYRYQNYYTSLFNQAVVLLMRDNFITNVKQIHCKSQSVADANDENVIRPKNVDLPEEITPIMVVDFLIDVMSEKEKLSKAIYESKSKAEIRIDDSISSNKMKQEFIETLRKMVDLRSFERDFEGIGYKINNDGNQVTYKYPVKEIITINYDRNKIKAIIKKYQKDCDDISNKIDREEILLEVDYVPKWDIDTSFEDAILS